MRMPLVQLILGIAAARALTDGAYGHDGAEAHAMRPASETLHTGARIVGARRLVVFALIVFVGMNLRSVILAVPPLLPSIQRDLGLSYTATGLLTSLPILMMGGTAWGAGLVIGHMGGRRAVAAGLALLAAGAALRVVWPGAVPLYAFTALLSLGIALAQTAMPVLTLQWFPLQIGLASALYSDGLILGESLSAALTRPVMRDIVGRGAWQPTFVAWAVPVVLALLLWLWLAPEAPGLALRRAPVAVGTAPSASEGPAAARPGVSAWHLGILLGGGSLIYFGMNGWIAPYNVAIHASAMTPLVLGVLNFAQLPVSLGITVFAQRLAGQRWPFVCAGAVGMVAVAGFVLMPPVWQPLWAALLGGLSGGVFTLGISLPALLARRETVARLTGATLTLSYGVAFLGPLAGGALWDRTGQSFFAFVPVAVAGVVLVVLGTLLPTRVALGLHVAPADRSPSASA